MAFYVYMLHCSDGSYYVGHSEDYEVRYTQHCEGMNRYTCKRLPVELAWVSDFPTRDQAKEFEYKLKKWNRKKKAALAAGDIEALKLAAKKTNWSTHRASKLDTPDSASPSRPARRAGRNEGSDIT
jgi:tRNA/rRNA methyltransferase